MAIALLGTPTTAFTVASGATACNINTPTAVQALTDPNTLLMWSVTGVAVSIANIATPAGWSVWQANTLASTNFLHVTFYRFASAEPTSYTMSGLTGGRYSANMRAYSGVDGVTPQDVTVTTAVSTTAMVSPAAITPVTTGAWVDCTNTVVTTTNITNTTWTSSNMTKDSDWTSQNTTSTNAAGGTAHFAWTSGAFTPNLTQATSTASRGISFTSALRPAFFRVPVTTTRAAVVRASTF